MLFNIYINILKLRIYLYRYLDGDPRDLTNLEIEEPIFILLHYLDYDRKDLW